MITIFYDNKIWDSYKDLKDRRTETVPLYAIAYVSEHKRWWCWYHSWNPLQANDPRVTEQPICKLFLLVNS